MGTLNLDDVSEIESEISEQQNVENQNKKNLEKLFPNEEDLNSKKRKAMTINDTVTKGNKKSILNLFRNYNHNGSVVFDSTNFLPSLIPSEIKKNAFPNKEILNYKKKRMTMTINDAVTKKSLRCMV